MKRNRPYSLFHCAYVAHAEVFRRERAFPMMRSFLGPGGSLDRFLCRKISRTDEESKECCGAAEDNAPWHGDGIGKSGIM